MKVGISVTSAIADSDVREGPRQMIARAKAAAEAGLSALFVGDHHVVPNPYYQNVPMIARMLAEWDQRDLGALFLLPMWHPVLAAEQIATLACLAQGKFIMQCGLGHGEAQFKAMGTKQRTRASAFEQSLELMRALWQGETVSSDGHWQFEGAQVSPLPPENIEVWIGASADIAIERAARMGDAWLASPGMLLDESARQMEVYLAALAKHKRAVPNTIAIRRDVYVAESGQEALNVRQALGSKGYRGFDPDALVIGDADEVAEQFLRYGALGYTDIIVRNLHREYHRAIESTERLSRVVELVT